MLFWRRFGRVLGRVLGGFWALLNGFQGFEDRSNFEAEVGTRKSGFKFTQGASRGSRKSGMEALILVNDHPSLVSLIVGSLESLIIGY